jgi:hypothetical protein
MYSKLFYQLYYKKKKVECRTPHYQTFYLENVLQHVCGVKPLGCIVKNLRNF